MQLQSVSRTPAIETEKEIKKRENYMCIAVARFGLGSAIANLAIARFSETRCSYVDLTPPPTPLAGCSEPHGNALVTSFAISHHKPEPTAPNHPCRTHLLPISTNTGSQSTPSRGSHSTCVPPLGQLRAQQMVTCRQCTLPALPQTSQHREGAAAVMHCSALSPLQHSHQWVHLLRGLKQSSSNRNPELGLC